MEPPATIAEGVAARGGDPRPALVFEGRTWSWSETVKEAAARASSLLQLRRADQPFHVGVLLDNTPEHVFTIFAAALAGATVVGLNPTRRGPELGRDVRHTDCQLLLTERAHAGLLEGIETAMDPILVDGPEWTGTVDHNRHAQLPSEPRAPDDLFLLIFTAGSTGAPKAVRMSQGRAARTTWGASRAFNEGDALYCSMPLFHGNALLANLFPALLSGATVVLRRRFSASAFLDDVRLNGCTYFNYVGRVLSYLLAVPERPDDGDNPIRWALGSEAAPRDIQEFQRRFRCLVVEAYGSSENGVVIRPAPGMPAGSLGKPERNADVTVVDSATGAECPPGRLDAGGRLLNPDEAIGEIVGRGAAERFEGYYNNPEAEAERSREGSYWTGDLGWRDAEGWFYFAGRSADWLRVDGENFSAALVEQVLQRYPPASGVAVYGVPDPETGDRVMVALEFSDADGFDPDDFTAFLQAQPDVGTKWPPAFLRITGRLPLTGVGKLDKVTLRSQAWRTEDKVWWRAGRDLDYRLFSNADRDELHQAFERAGRSNLLPRG